MPDTGCGRGSRRGQGGAVGVGRGRCWAWAGRGWAGASHSCSLISSRAPEVAVVGSEACGGLWRGCIPVRRAPPEYARGRGEGGWAAVALRGLRSAVSTRPHPALPARAALATRARVVPGRAGRGLWIPPLRVGSLLRRALRRGPYPGGVASWRSPPETAAVSGKATVFRSGLSFLLKNDAVRDRWFGCVLFLSLFFFFF